VKLNQTGRLIRMTKGPLGPDEIVLSGFFGSEAISRPFSFRVDFISNRLDLRPNHVVGKQIAIELDRRDRLENELPPRFFHGYVNRFAASNAVIKEWGEHVYRQYRMEIVPWLWFLSLTTRCYVFFPEKEDKSIYEIIEAVFQRAKNDLHVEPANDMTRIKSLKNRKVKHCVQYRETDFNFVSRIMEQYGVFYYFKFEDGKHTLVLDMNKNYAKCAEAEVMYPRVRASKMIGDHITDWQHEYEFVSGKWSHTDYNFETPSTSLKTVVPRLPSIELEEIDKYEMYDYPGGYAVVSEGESDAKIRQEEMEVAHSFVHGSSTCRTFTPGHTFKLTVHPDEDAVSEQGKSYLLTTVEHSASQPTDDTSDRTSANYENRFTCIPDSIQFRPARTTRKPIVSGVQTALVVGPAGEEIHTDKYGRVKVQFHWDREGKKDGHSSCWIRVSQNWSGKAWGGMYIPHVGHEVIVDFLEGDPDQPIIVGRVYNAEQTVPLDLPDNKTKCIIRDYGGNETIMEGKSGEQFIHTQQTCGNEFLMDGASGQEKILLRDKYGNEIILDAVEKVIKIYCPTHESAIILGRSLEFWSISDYKINIGGKEQKVVDGSKHENILGISSKIIGGWKQETVIGIETKINLVAKLELIKAYNVKKKLSKEFSTIKEACAEIRKDVMAAALSTKLAISTDYEVGATKINDLADKIEIHGEQTAEMRADRAEVHAKMLELTGKCKMDGPSVDIKPKCNICNGTFKVDGPGGKSPKAPRKRKKSKLTAQDVKDKSRKAMQKASRRKNRGK
jgi:type VI secretion system secreted protein VgrG